MRARCSLPTPPHASWAALWDFLVALCDPGVQRAYARSQPPFTRVHAQLRAKLVSSVRRPRPRRLFDENETNETDDWEDEQRGNYELASFAPCTSSPRTPALPRGSS
eukprot:7364837-Prymnesium_polylepis.1